MNVIKKYFLYVPFWLSVLVNIILGIIGSWAFLVGCLFIDGLYMFSPPTPEEQLTGWLIMLGIVLVILLVNFIVYEICKRIRVGKEAGLEETEGYNKFWIVLVILVCLIFSFFIFSDLWRAIHGWWF